MAFDVHMMGWEDVAMAFVPHGATLTFARCEDDDPVWGGDGPDLYPMAKLEQRIDEDTVATFATPLGRADAVGADDARHAADFVRNIRDYLDDVKGWDTEGEVGEEEAGVYRKWSIIASGLSDRFGL